MGTVRDTLPLLALMRSQRVEIWIKTETNALPSHGRRLTRDQVTELLGDECPAPEDRRILDAEVLEINGSDRCMAITALAV